MTNKKMKFMVLKFNKDSLIGFACFLKYTPRKAPEFNYIFDRWLRDITLRNQSHPLTDLLKEVLIEYNLYSNDFMNMNEMRRKNKKLKQLGFKSENCFLLNPFHYKFQFDLLLISNFQLIYMNNIF